MDCYIISNFYINALDVEYGGDIESSLSVLFTHQGEEKVVGVIDLIWM